MLRVGVAGLGRGVPLLRVFHAHPECDVVAVCDPQERRRAWMAEEMGITDGVETFDEFLERDLDVVVVATPLPVHATQSIQAMEAGAHVLSEVPAASTLEDCAAIVKAVRRTGRTYMMAENMCTYHYVLDWKRRVREGEIGDVFYAEAEYVHDCRGILRDREGHLTWRGAMPPIHYGTHSLGPVLDIMDDRCVEAVGMHTGSRTAPEIGSTDMEVGLFRTARGAVVKILCGFTVTRKPAFHWQVFYGTKGTLENRRVPWEEAKIFREGDERMSAVDAPVSDPGAPAEAAAPAGHGTCEHYMIRGFVQAILDGTPPPIDVYRSMDYTVPGLCAHLSAEQGSTPVAVPDFRKG